MKSKFTINFLIMVFSVSIFASTGDNNLQQANNLKKLTETSISLLEELGDDYDNDGSEEYIEMGKLQKAHEVLDKVQNIKDQILLTTYSNLLLKKIALDDCYSMIGVSKDLCIENAISFTESTLFNLKVSSNNE